MTNPSHPGPTHTGPMLAWVMIAVIAGGFIISGISLVFSLPWLFFTGVGVIVFGIVVSWWTHVVSASSRTFPSRAQAERRET